MRTEEPIRADDVSRASAEAEAHVRAPALAAFADDVLFRQAEGRSLYAGEGLVRLRADAHGVLPEDAGTPFGNLVEIFEAGPNGPREHALVAAFAVRGFAERLRRASVDERGMLVARFVRHADWLELATPYRVYPFVHSRMPPEARALLRDALADAVVDDAGSPQAATPAIRARNAARLTALADLPDADEAFDRIAEVADDPVTQTLAAGLALGEPILPRGGDGPRIYGHRGSPPRAAWRNTLRLISGVAVFQWLGRLLARLVSLQRNVEVVLLPPVVRVHAETRIFGRVVREEHWSVPLTSVGGAVRHARWPAVHLLVGAATLSLGVFGGGLWAIDAARTGETYLAFAAAGVLLVGAGLDLALDVFVRGPRAEVAFELDLGRSGHLALVGVDLAAADSFLDALEVASRTSR